MLFKQLCAVLATFGGHYALAQLSGSVGPTTSLSSKQATICNVLNYGGVIGSSVREHLPFLIESSIN